MNILKRAAISALAAITAGTFGIHAFAHEDITVKLEAFTSKTMDIVNFSTVKPVQIDSCTYVPARTLAEAAGMEVQWDQSTQTALITLYADAYSEKPIERYASELIDKIGGYGLDLQPDSITAALKLYDTNAVIRYNFTDTEGDVVAIGKTIKMDSAAELVNDAALMIPLRNSMELFGLDVSWNQDDMTARISIPEDVFVPSGLSIIANHAPAEQKTEIKHSSGLDGIPTMDYDEYLASLVKGAYTEQVVEENSPVDTNPQHGAYIGRFKITHYCPCSVCNGGWGPYTAWAGEIIPNQTIAVDSSLIGKLTWVYIDGYGLRRAEDCGGGIKGYHIDVAVSSHEEALSKGVVYKDVYYAE